MSVLSGYLIRQFLRHFAVMLLAFVALLQLFDLLKNANDVIEEHGGRVFAAAEYAWLRFPDIVAFALPFAVLIGALLALAKLSHFNEIVALRSMGRSLFRVVFSLMPAAFLIAAAHFILADQVVPRTQRALDLFNAQSEERKATRADEEGRTVWLRDGHQLVRVDYVVDEGRKLFGIALFDRSSEGQLRGRTLADNAEYQNESWMLHDVQRLTFGGDGVADFETMATWRWDTLLTPQQFRELSLPPSRLSLTENLNFIENPGYATHPPHLYKTWVHERLSAPFATFIMVLLAGPIAGRVSRQGGMGRSLALGVLFGFAFFISDGLLLAMGESGKLPPILATWTPVAAFSCLGLGLLIHREGW